VCFFCGPFDDVFRASLLLTRGKISLWPLKAKIITAREKQARKRGEEKKVR
jgi:hypothetical protein